MLINISTDQLKDIFQTASLTISKDKNSILNNSLLSIKKNIVLIYSTNGITTSKQYINLKTAETTKDIQLIIPTEKLNNLIKQLQNKDTIIEINDKILTIKNENLTTSYKTLDPDLYPIEETEQKDFITNINYETLKHIIKSTIYASSKNDIAREYTGILIEIDKGTLTTTATDRFRLKTISVNTDINPEINFKQIIENEGASLITKINMENPSVYKNRHSITLTSDNLEISAKTIDGMFPDYKQILLSKNEKNITIDRKKLLNAIKRMSIVYENQETIIKINTNTSKLTIETISQEGEQSNDIVDIIDQKNAKDIEFKLNCRYVIDFLSHIFTDEIELFYKTNQEPIMFHAHDEKIYYKYLLLPIIDE